jgi:hypothetical protein
VCSRARYFVFVVAPPLRAGAGAAAGTGVAPIFDIADMYVLLKLFRVLVIVNVPLGSTSTFSQYAGVWAPAPPPPPPR